MKKEIKKLPYIRIKDSAWDSEVVCIKRGYVQSALLGLQILIAKADYNELDIEIKHLLDELEEIK